MFARTACSPAPPVVPEVCREQPLDRGPHAVHDRAEVAGLVLGRPASSSRVARIAPHWEWPSTTTSRVPKRAAANSTLPTWDGATMLPATRITNRSPRP